MSRSLAEMVSDAVNTYNTYRSPVLSEFVAAIDPVLDALGESTIGNDSVNYLSSGTYGLNLRTTSYCRGCQIDHAYEEIPWEIINAPDPVLTAKRYALSKMINRHTQNIERLTRELDLQRDYLEQFTAELETLNKEHS